MGGGGYVLCSPPNCIYECWGAWGGGGGGGGGELKDKQANANNHMIYVRIIIHCKAYHYWPCTTASSYMEHASQTRVYVYVTENMTKGHRPQKFQFVTSLLGNSPSNYHTS